MVRRPVARAWRGLHGAVADRRWRFFPFVFVGFFFVGGDTAAWWRVLPFLVIVPLVLWLTLRRPAAVREGADLGFVRARLRELGRLDLLGELDRGAEEYAALRAWWLATGDLDGQERDARAEAAELHTKAEAATDPETAATWRGGAALAERRAERIRGMRADFDRVSAKLSAFEQVVKTLRVDLTRAGGPPPELDAHGTDLGRQVDALVRARAEVRSL